MERREQASENGPISIAAVESIGVAVHLKDRHSRGEVLVAIPAYNEERFIGSVVLEVRLKGYEVLVVDDGSQDRTAEVAAAAGAIVERHERNVGKAEAVNTAFRKAQAMGVGSLVLMDGDSQHNADEIDGLLAPVLAGQADIVIGSRYLTGSRGRIPGIRSVGQVGMTIATNIASGTAVTDSQSGFRAFSERAIETLLFRARGFSVEGEMQFQARDHELRVIEMPITARYDDPPKRSVVRHGFMVLDGVFRLAARHRPLLFFGSPGALLVLMGLAIGLHVQDIYARTQELAIGYSLLTVLCTIVGLVALFTGITLHAMRAAYLDLERRIVAMDGVHRSRPRSEARRDLNDRRLPLALGGGDGE